LNGTHELYVYELKGLGERFLLPEICLASAGLLRNLYCYFSITYWFQQRKEFFYAT
jgi:hypothetical protein